MSNSNSTTESKPEIYQASKVKRNRATKDEMEARARFLLDYSDKHGPVTVRGLYYQAEVRHLPGIDKADNSYDKIQRQVLQLRRDGRMSYRNISDLTRWMRKPRSHTGVEAALELTARTYRKALWDDTDVYVEVWCEKDALAGVIYPVTSEYDVPLMVARGFSSETFAFEAVAARLDDQRPYYVYYLGDFDRAGQDAARSLEEKLRRFADEEGVEVVFETIGVTEQQIRDWALPTRQPKRITNADKKWPHSFACELDAIEPDVLRDLVRACIDKHLPRREFEILKVAEASERKLIKGLVGLAIGDAS